MANRDHKESGRVHIRRVRELAESHSREELTGCIRHQLNGGENPCLPGESTPEVVNVLAKAEYVRGLMDGGMTVTEAVRELASRIRVAQERLGLTE